MANLITNTEVFDFMGTDAGQRTNHGSAVTAMITKKQAELESTLRRKLETQAASSVVIFHGKGCEIYNDKLFLKGVYRDFYSISALSEEGTTLTASTAYNDGNDYVADFGKGIIYRVGDVWSKAVNAITISGNYGYLNSSNAAREEVKQILIEMVAAVSGLWYKEYQTDQGTVTEKRMAITRSTEKMIKNHINYG